MENEDKLFKQSIGKRLKAFRIDMLGIDRRYMADLVSKDLGEKISESTLQKWEELSPSWRYLIWFKNRYRKSWNWILEGKTPEIEP